MLTPSMGETPPRDLRGLQRAHQLQKGDRPFVLIAVIAAGEDDRRAVAVSNRDDGQVDSTPAGLVARMGHAQMAELLAFGLDIDGYADFGLACRHELLPVLEACPSVPVVLPVLAQTPTR
jgi:hypothetical protein